MEFRLDFRKHFFSEGVAMQWHRPPRGVVESLFLDKNHVHVALKDVVSEHGGGLAVGLGDLSHIFQSQCFYENKTLFRDYYR